MNVKMRVEWNGMMYVWILREEKKGKKRILPTWILEGKKLDPQDTDKNDSTKAEIITSRIKELFKMQEQKQIKEHEKNTNFPIKLTTKKRMKKRTKGNPKTISHLHHQHRDKAWHHPRQSQDDAKKVQRLPATPQG